MHFLFAGRFECDVEFGVCYEAEAVSVADVGAVLQSVVEPEEHVLYRNAVLYAVVGGVGETASPVIADGENNRIR